MSDCGKLVTGCVLGNVLELYDFVIYSFFSALFAKLFFPQYDHYTGIILTLSIFASSCLVRPIGAILFGYYGDKYGRKKSLLISISLITFATVMIGLTPSYNSIGIYAPLILILSRIIQGLSMTSEEVSSAIFLAESAPTQFKHLCSGLVIASVYFGLFLAAITCSIIVYSATENSIEMGLWRIPFLLSLPIGILSWHIRNKQIESYEFTEIRNKKLLFKNPIKILFKDYLPTVITLILGSSIFSVGIYILAVYMPIFFTDKFGMKESLAICSVGFMGAAITSLVVAFLNRENNPKKFIYASCFIIIFFSTPLFDFLKHATFIASLAGSIVLGISIGMSSGSLMQLFIDSFPTNIRLSGVAVVFNFSMTLFGSSAPILAMLLTNTPYIKSSASFILTMSAIITIMSLYFSTKREKEMKIVRI